MDDSGSVFGLFDGLFGGLTFLNASHGENDLGSTKAEVVTSGFQAKTNVGAGHDDCLACCRSLRIREGIGELSPDQIENVADE